MKASSLVFLIAVLAVYNLYAQDKFSVQLSGGIITPINSSKGLTGLLQVNYSISENSTLYAYFSTSSWYHNNILINKDNMHPIEAYDEDRHILNSFNAGDRIIFNRNKFFDAFADVELGYIHLNYRKLSLSRYVNSDGTIEYLNDYASSAIAHESVLGTGIGVGLQHHMIDRFDLLLNLKLNTFMNDVINGNFTFDRTYLTYMFGFVYKI